MRFTKIKKRYEKENLNTICENKNKIKRYKREKLRIEI